MSPLAFITQTIILRSITSQTPRWTHMILQSLSVYFSTSVVLFVFWLVTRRLLVYTRRIFILLHSNTCRHCRACWNTTQGRDSLPRRLSSRSILITRSSACQCWWLEIQTVSNFSISNVVTLRNSVASSRPFTCLENKNVSFVIEGRVWGTYRRRKKVGQCGVQAQILNLDFSAVGFLTSGTFSSDARTSAWRLRMWLPYHRVSELIFKWLMNKIVQYCKHSEVLAWPWLWLQSDLYPLISQQIIMIENW